MVRCGGGSGGGVDVWLVRPAPIAAHLLEVDELDRAARFRRAEDRDAYLAAHRALRLLVGQALGRHPAEVRFGAGAVPPVA